MRRASTHSNRLLLLYKLAKRLFLAREKMTVSGRETVIQEKRRRRKPLSEWFWQETNTEIGCNIEI